MGVCHKLTRTHGYCERGKRLFGITSGKRQGRSNIIGAWSTTKKLFATQTFEQNINKARFMDWLKASLLPQLQAGMVVIMDNAPWHKGKDIKNLIENTGAKLLNLPPYSPDFNPIEQAWANLKAAIKKTHSDIPDIRQNIATQLEVMSGSKCG